MENKQYIKYKDYFKKQCIYTAIGSIFSIVTILFVIFFDVFKIKLKVEGETLDLIKFSLFDVIKDVVKNLSHLGLIDFFFSLSLVFFIFAMIGSGISTFKNIMNVTNLDDYSLTEYDNIKHRIDDKKNKRANRFNTNYFFYAAIVYLIFSIWFGRFIGSISDASEVEFSNLSYVMLFLNVNGVNAIVILPVLTLIASIVFTVIGSNMKKKIKTSILKEEYSNPQSAGTL